MGLGIWLGGRAVLLVQTSVFSRSHAAFLDTKSGAVGSIEALSKDKLSKITFATKD